MLEIRSRHVDGFVNSTSFPAHGQLLPHIPRGWHTYHILSSLTQPRCLRMDGSHWHILFPANYFQGCKLPCLLHWHKHALLTLTHPSRRKACSEHVPLGPRESVSLKVWNWHHFVKWGLDITPKVMMSWKPGVQSKITAFISITRKSQEHSFTCIISFGSNNNPVR